VAGAGVRAAELDVDAELASCPAPHPVSHAHAETTTIGQILTAIPMMASPGRRCLTLLRSRA
jgi:hypothetical protein